MINFNCLSFDHILDSSRRTTAQFRASASVSKKLSVTGMGMNSQEAVGEFVSYTT